jgi:23S rRNA pseudouridine2605 synthase
MNNYEKGQGHSSYAPKPNADRDGKTYEKRDVKFTPKRPRFIDKNSRKVQENTDFQSSERPVFVKKPFSERKPFKPFAERNGEGGNENYRPRGEYQPRREFQSRGEYKPRGERNFTPYPRDGERPSFNRYNNNNNRTENHDGNRYNNRDENGGNRYFNRNENHSGNRFELKKRDGDYNPNAKYSHKKQTEYRKTFIDPNKPVRLNKFLANAGICSRREADEYIQAGVITINGEVASTLGTKVMPTDQVMFHNQPIRSERKVYILLNKPKDCITTAEDTHDRTTVIDIVKNACSERVYPVGRLDRNTTGVILITNDGDLASRLTHPKFDKKKIYHAVLDRPIETADFEKILAGVQLDDDTVIAADALEFVKDDDKKQLGIEIHSGQNRVVRRIFEKLGYRISRLDRVYFAGLTKKNLPRGKYRFLTEREVNMLKMGAYE